MPFFKMLSRFRATLLTVAIVGLLIGALAVYHQARAGSSGGTIGAADCYTSNGGSCNVLWSGNAALDSGWEMQIWVDGNCTGDLASGPISCTKMLSAGTCKDGTLITHSPDWTGRIDYTTPNPRGCAKAPQLSGPSAQTVGQTPTYTISGGRPNNTVCWQVNSVGAGCNGTTDGNGNATVFGGTWAQAGTYTILATVGGDVTNSITITVSNGTTAVCGNGVKEGAEQCDSGSANGACPATCSTSCMLNACGSTVTCSLTANGTEGPKTVSVNVGGSVSWAYTWSPTNGTTAHTFASLNNAGFVEVGSFGGSPGTSSNFPAAPGSTTATYTCPAQGSSYTIATYMEIRNSTGSAVCTTQPKTITVSVTDPQNTCSSATQSSLKINNATTGAFQPGQVWTLTLASAPANTALTICAKFNGGTQSCTPLATSTLCAQKTTSASGTWSCSGTFSASNAGSWEEWMIANTTQSNHVTFTVGSGSTGSIVSVTLAPPNPITVVLGTTPQNKAVWSASSNPTGLDAFWNGTNTINGITTNVTDVPVTDATGKPVKTNFSLPFVYDCTMRGTYTRSLKVRNAAGATKSSNTVTFSVTDPNRTCTTVTPPSGPTLRTDKTAYVVQNTPLYKLSGVPPNTAIQWSSWKNGVSTGEVDSTYGHMTKADGTWQGYGDTWNITHIGSWRKRANVGTVATSVTFTVANLSQSGMTLAVGRTTYQVEEVPLYAIAASPPNTPIAWSSWKDTGSGYVSTGETDAVYKDASGKPLQVTDAKGYWSGYGGVWTPGQVGKWRKQAKVGTTTAQVYFTVSGSGASAAPAPPPSCSNIAGFASSCAGDLHVADLPSIPGEPTTLTVNLAVTVPADVATSAIWNKTYYWSESEQAWVMVLLSGSPYPGAACDNPTLGCWLTGNAAASFPVSVRAARGGKVYTVAWEYMWQPSTQTWSGPACTNSTNDCWRTISYSTPAPVTGTAVVTGLEVIKKGTPADSVFVYANQSDTLSALVRFSDGSISPNTTVTVSSNEDASLGTIAYASVDANGLVTITGASPFLQTTFEGTERDAYAATLTVHPAAVGANTAFDKNVLVSVGKSDTSALPNPETEPDMPAYIYELAANKSIFSLTDDEKNQIIAYFDANPGVWPADFIPDSFISWSFRLGGDVPDSANGLPLQAVLYGYEYKNGKYVSMFKPADGTGGLVVGTNAATSPNAVDAIVNAWNIGSRYGFAGVVGASYGVNAFATAYLYPGLWDASAKVFLSSLKFAGQVFLPVSVVITGLEIANWWNNKRRISHYKQDDTRVANDMMQKIYVLVNTYNSNRAPDGIKEQQYHDAIVSAVVSIFHTSAAYFKLPRSLTSQWGYVEGFIRTMDATLAQRLAAFAGL